MSRVQLAYGRSGMWVDVADSADVIEPRYVPGLQDEPAAIRQALRAPTSGPPLAGRVPRGAPVAISVCDVTRPFPSRRVLPILLEELRDADSGPVTLFIATGTHRVCTPDELDQTLGPDVRSACSVVQHDAFDTAAAGASRQYRSRRHENREAHHGGIPFP